MEIESMKSGAAASYQGSAAAASTKTPDTAVQPEASTQAGLSQTADKKPAVQNFLQKRIRRIRIRPRKKMQSRALS